MNFLIDNEDRYFAFEDGTLSVGIECDTNDDYEIRTEIGRFVWQYLSKEETKQLFKAMKEYYSGQR